MKKCSLLWEAVKKGAGENRKQGGPRASEEARVTPSIISAFNLHLSAIQMSFKKTYNKDGMSLSLLGCSTRFVCSMNKKVTQGELYLFWVWFLIVLCWLHFGEYYFVLLNIGFTSFFAC